jgi:hypothetical protein
MTFTVTSHAVDRYRERFAPESPGDEVRRYLEWALPYSEGQGVTALGRERRVLPCGAVVVTMPRAGGAVVVTVLPPPVPEPVALPRGPVRAVERRVLRGHGFRWWAA